MAGRNKWPPRTRTISIIGLDVPASRGLVNVIDPCDPKAKAYYFLRHYTFEKLDRTPSNDVCVITDGESQWEIDYRFNERMPPKIGASISLLGKQCISEDVKLKLEQWHEKRK